MDETYMDIVDLEIYQRLCKLYIEAVTRDISAIPNGLELSLEKH